MARKRGVGATISEIDLLGRDTDPPPLRLAKKGEKPEDEADNGAQPKVSVEGEGSPEPKADQKENGRPEQSGEEVASAVAAIIEGESVESEPASEPEPQPGARNGAGADTQSKPARRARRKKRSAVNVGVELYLPEDLLFRARSLVRPHRTGARRSLGAAFVLQAYVRAVDELLGGELDVQGIEQGADEEMVERVKLALERALGGD